MATHKQPRIHCAALIERDCRLCPKCGAKNALTVRFCNNCGQNLTQAAQPSGQCAACGAQNPPSTKFCGECGIKLS